MYTNLMNGASPANFVPTTLQTKLRIEAALKERISQFELKYQKLFIYHRPETNITG